MLSGSPTGNRNAGGPGLDANRARALAYLKGRIDWPAYGSRPLSLGHVKHRADSS
jgi:hypothetical protein